MKNNMISRSILLVTFVMIVTFVDVAVSFQIRGRTIALTNDVSILNEVDVYGGKYLPLSSTSKLRMGLDITDVTHFSQLLADSPKPICPAFGEPGWAPFCFLQGNPLFNTFDAFQGKYKYIIKSIHNYSFVSLFLSIHRFYSE